MKLGILMGMLVIAALENPMVARADCAPAYAAKIQVLGDKAEGVKTSWETFLGATGVSAAVAGPAAWIGDGALAISTGMIFVWEKHEQTVFKQARELLDEAAKGDGPRLEQLYKKLEKKDHSLRIEDVAQTVASGDQDEAFCGKKLFKEGDIQKWATRELKLR